MSQNLNIAYKMYDMELDDLDFTILMMLQKEGRITIKTLADKLEKRRATVYARLQKLEENKVIEGYTISINYREIGFPITAFILVAMAKEAFQKFNKQDDLLKALSDVPFVVEVYSITGEYDYLLKARVKSLEDVGDKIVYYIRKNLPISRTLTLPVFSTGEEERMNINTLKKLLLS